VAAGACMAAYGLPGNSSTYSFGTSGYCLATGALGTGGFLTGSCGFSGASGGPAPYTDPRRDAPDHTLMVSATEGA